MFFLTIFVFSASVLLAMIEVENIDFIFPWLAPKLRSINQQVDNLKNCRSVRILRQAKRFIQRRPFVSLFLALSIPVGFLPLIVFGAFVGGFLFITLFAALTALSGVLFVTCAWILAILLPTLVIGGFVAFCVYVPYYVVMKLLRILKGFESMMMGYSSKLWESFGSLHQGKAQIAHGHKQDFASPKEEMLGEEYVVNMNEEYNGHNVDGPEYRCYPSPEEYSPESPYSPYSRCREDYRYNSSVSRRFKKRVFSPGQTIHGW